MLVFLFTDIEGSTRLWEEHTAEMGAVIAPPMPAMYAQPQTIDDMVRQSVGRILDLFGLPSEETYRWRG